MHICEFFSQFVWMWIFCSILLVSVAFIISSRIYKKMYPGIKLNSEEVVLIPFRYWSSCPLVLILSSDCSIWPLIVHMVLLLVIVSSDWPLRLYSLKVWQTDRHGQSYRDSITSKNYLHLILIFLAPTGAQEVTICVCSFVRPSGPNLSRALNL